MKLILIVTKQLFICYTFNKFSFILSDQFSDTNQNVRVSSVDFPDFWLNLLQKLLYNFGRKKYFDKNFNLIRALT